MRKKKSSDFTTEKSFPPLNLKAETPPFFAAEKSKLVFSWKMSPPRTLKENGKDFSAGKKSFNEKLKLFFSRRRFLRFSLHLLRLSGHFKSLIAQIPEWTGSLQGEKRTNDPQSRVLAYSVFPYCQSKARGKCLMPH